MWPGGENRSVPAALEKEPAPRSRSVSTADTRGQCCAANAAEPQLAAGTCGRPGTPPLSHRCRVAPGALLTPAILSPHNTLKGAHSSASARRNPCGQPGRLCSGLTAATGGLLTPPSPHPPSLGPPEVPAGAAGCTVGFCRQWREGGVTWKSGLGGTCSARENADAPLKAKESARVGSSAFDSLWDLRGDRSRGGWAVRRRPTLRRIGVSQRGGVGGLTFRACTQPQAQPLESVMC